MKKAQVTFIVNSLKAREILFANKSITANSKNAVTKWCASASDDDVADIAKQADWSEAVTPVDDVVVDLPNGVEKTTITITDSLGNQVPVDVYNLPFLRTKREWIYKGGVKDRRQIAFQFAFGGVTVKTHSKLLTEAYNNGELEKGDVIPFKAESITRTVVPANAKLQRKSYSFLEGATLEAGCELLEDAREAIESREDDIAMMSAEGQSLLGAQTAQNEVDAFLAKHGA